MLWRIKKLATSLNFYLVFLLFFFSLFCVASIPVDFNYQNSSSYTQKNNLDKKSGNSYSLSYIPSNPISISSDYGLFLISSSGNGSQDFPYIIEGYNISVDSYAISISHTHRYFAIRNCYIYSNNSNAFGIRIIDVAEGTSAVLNNTIIGTDEAIYISLSSRSIISNNFCENNNQALEISRSENSLITNNTCINNYEGIEIDRCTDSLITNNTCSFNTQNGIETYRESDSCSFVDNVLESNGGYGISIHVESSKNNIYRNTFINNNPGVGSQACDSGKRNKWYNIKTGEGNFWSNLGNNCKYKIDGDARSKDIYPLNRDQTCPNPKIRTMLAIVLPLVGFVGLMAFLIPKYIIPYHQEKNIFISIKNSFFKERMMLYTLLGAIFIVGAIILFAGWYMHLWSDRMDGSLIVGSVLCSSVVIVSTPILIQKIRKSKKPIEEKPIEDNDIN